MLIASIPGVHSLEVVSRYRDPDLQVTENVKVF